MSDSPARALPARPHLNWLKNRAREGLEILRATDPTAQLAAAQLAVAREYGFPSWRALKAHVDAMRDAAAPPDDNDRHSLAGVPVLAWGKSGETTFCGALAAALAVTDRAAPYPTLMGDSGLAMRLRWYRADDPAEPNGWCNSSPVGEFSPWTDLAARSVGYRMRWETHLPGFNAAAPTAMSRFADDVVDSIDAGLPVLCYPSQRDMGVIYGYENAGRTLLVRDYYKGPGEHRISIDDVSGLLAFLSEKSARPTRRDATIAGLRQMVDDDARPPARSDRDGRPGAYRFGADAYRTWLADLTAADDMPAPQQANLFRTGWWAFDVLVDARFAAQSYLTAAADELFTGPPRDALRRAAEAASGAARALVSAYPDKDSFFGPWSGKKFEDWTATVRRREIERLSAARDADATAITEIRAALAMIESTT